MGQLLSFLKQKVYTISSYMPGDYLNWKKKKNPQIKSAGSNGGRLSQKR